MEPWTGNHPAASASKGPPRAHRLLPVSKRIWLSYMNYLRIHIRLSIWYIE